MINDICITLPPRRSLPPPLVLSSLRSPCEHQWLVLCPCPCHHLPPAFSSLPPPLPSSSAPPALLAFLPRSFSTSLLLTSSPDSIFSLARPGFPSSSSVSPSTASAPPRP